VSAADAIDDDADGGLESAAAAPAVAAEPPPMPGWKQLGYMLS
jgi:hypothetical protein